MIIIFWEMTPLPEDDNHHSHRRGNLKSYKDREAGKMEIM
jgi:hypothetical protein